MILSLFFSTTQSPLSELNLRIKIICFSQVLHITTYVCGKAVETKSIQISRCEWRNALSLEINSNIELQLPTFNIERSIVQCSMFSGYCFGIQISCFEFMTYAIMCFLHSVFCFYHFPIQNVPNILSRICSSTLLSMSPSC